MLEVAPPPFMGGDSTATVTSAPSEPPPTRTISELVDDVGWLTSRAGLHVHDAAQLHFETRQLHVDALSESIRARADVLARVPLRELLATLGEAGFAWRDVARIVGVSVPALRKWRLGEQATPENRLRVAGLIALCEQLLERAMIPDAASWLEVPLLEDVPVSGLDLLAGNRRDLVLRRALHHDADPESILDEFEPEWRSTYRSGFDVFQAEDGLPGIRPRDADG